LGEESPTNQPVEEVKKIVQAPQQVQTEPPELREIRELKQRVEQFTQQLPPSPEIGYSGPLSQKVKDIAQAAQALTGQEKLWDLLKGGEMDLTKALIVMQLMQNIQQQQMINVIMQRKFLDELASPSTPKGDFLKEIIKRIEDLEKKLVEKEYVKKINELEKKILEFSVKKKSPEELEALKKEIASLKELLAKKEKDELLNRLAELEKKLSGEKSETLESKLAEKLKEKLDEKLDEAINEVLSSPPPPGGELNLNYLAKEVIKTAQKLIDKLPAAPPTRKEVTKLPQLPPQQLKVKPKPETPEKSVKKPAKKQVASAKPSETKKLSKPEKKVSEKREEKKSGEGKK